MRKIIIAYIPALHEGYMRFLQLYPEAELFIMSDEVIRELSIKTPYFGRDVRAIEPEQMVKAIESLKIVSRVNLLASYVIEELQKAEDLEIIMPTEDISITFHQRYLSHRKISFQSFFLRWDKLISTKEMEVNPDRIISEDQMDFELMSESGREAKRSPDWWRQVGALAAKDGVILLTGYNHHMPHEQSAYVLGDPRQNFNAGESIDISLALHAEVAVISEAAKRGKALEGSSIYVTTFPCQGCARSMVASGIKKVYYRDGYSRLDAEDVLKAEGIEIVLVKK